MGVTESEGQRSAGRRWFAWAVVVLAIAACLRPAITAIGPLVEQIREQTGLHEAGLGMLTALPLLAFAVISPVVSMPAQRIGIERVILMALGVLTVGILLRSVPGAAALWGGTVLIGVGIAIGNVLVPVIVKRDFPQRVSLMTGLYTAVLSLSAASAAGLMVPISQAVPGGWRTALALCALTPALCAIAWAVMTRRERAASRARTSVVEVMTGALPVLPEAPDAPGASRVSLLRSPIAWTVTLFMGVQSTLFYTVAMWMPSMELEVGQDAATAGFHLFLMQATSVIGNLSVSFLAEKRPSQSWLALVLTGCILAAGAGALAWPAGSALWAVLVGIGTGGSFALGLALIGLRTSTPAQTMRLSGMAQCVGYLLAAAGPLLAGSLAEAWGSWAWVVVVLLALGVVQAVAGAISGRNVRIGARSGNR